MKKYIYIAMLCLLPFSSKAQQSQTPDENFYVYLCLGQSNMEGNAQPEAVDKEYVDARFQMLACVNFDSPARTMGSWYTAYPPIVRQGTGLGMADYFGRTMVANLPEQVKVGVVDVAIGGTKIEGFMSEKVADYIAPEADWLKAYFAAYDNDPYKRLVDMAKIAQQSGVIKGVLLHQGESNSGDMEWPQKVKTVYERLLSDLNLNAEDVPLFVGEVVSANANGSCAGHNTIIAKVPDVIPTAHIISSEGCPQKGDRLHFTAAGYRTMGKRYAAAALELMGIEVDIDDDPMETPFVLDQKLTSLAELSGKQFVIYNEDTQCAFYGVNEQNLGYAGLSEALRKSNTTICFKLEPTGSYYFLRALTPTGAGYTIWGSPGYLNSGNWNCFILGNTKKKNGEDIENGAVWDIQYVTDKGFSLRNIGTGKYLRATGKAINDTPTYFSFYTIKENDALGITIPSVSCKVLTDDTVYSLQGIKVGSIDNWASLPCGLYIVNGKKIVKK